MPAYGVTRPQVNYPVATFEIYASENGTGKHRVSTNNKFILMRATFIDIPIPWEYTMGRELKDMELTAFVLIHVYNINIK